jgi:hypothetical protein
MAEICVAYVNKTKLSLGGRRGDGATGFKDNGDKFTGVRVPLEKLEAKSKHEDTDRTFPQPVIFS